jgi:hypothetical protein
MSDISPVASLAALLYSMESDASPASDLLFNEALKANRVPIGGPGPSVRMIEDAVGNSSADALLRLAGMTRDPDALRALARSSSVKVRRLVARVSELPEDAARYLLAWSYTRTKPDVEVFQVLSARADLPVRDLAEGLVKHPELRNGLYGRLAPARILSDPETVAYLVSTGELDSKSRCDLLAALLNGAHGVSAEQVRSLLGLLSEHDRRRLAVELVQRSALDGNVAGELVGELITLIGRDSVYSTAVFNTFTMSDEVARDLLRIGSIPALSVLCHNSSTPDWAKAETAVRLSYGGGGGEPGREMDAMLVGLVRSNELPEELTVQMLSRFNANQLTRTVSGLLYQHPSTAVLSAIVARLHHPDVGSMVPTADLVRLARTANLPLDDALTILRNGDWEITEKVLVSLQGSGTDRPEAVRAELLERLLDEPGFAFAENKSVYRNGAYRYERDVASFPEEIFRRYGQRLLLASHAEMLEVLMTRWNGALHVLTVSENPRVAHWLHARLAEPPGTRAQRFELLLNLMPDWDQTPAELVATVSAI